MTPRHAVTLLFLVHGAMYGNWIARIPDIKDKFGFSEGELGLVLLGLPLGVVIGLPLVSGFISRAGSRNVAFWSAMAFCGIVPILSLMPSPVTLTIILVAFGSITSTNDVSINAQAVEVERRANRSIMSSFHAAFSIGAVIGALMGEFLTDAGFSLQEHLFLAGGIFFLVTLAASRQLIDVEGEQQSGGAVFTLPSRKLLPLGAVAFCAAMGEGVMADWTGIYLSDVVDVSGEIDGFGFAAFSTMMTIGRLSGDYLVDRFDTGFMVAMGGVLGSSGLMLAVLWPAFVPTLIGFAMVGAGLASMIPLMFAISGRMPGLPPGAGIAGTATIGYMGFLAAPPLIGLVADATSLRVSFTLLAILISALIPLSRVVRSYSGRMVQQQAATA